MPRIGRSPSSTPSSRRCRCSRPALYALARRAADRAAGSASDILRLAIPKRMVRAEKAWLAAPPRRSARGRRRARAPGRTAALGAFPGLGEAIAPRRAARRRRAAVDRRGSADGREVGAWAVLLAAAAVHTLARGPLRDPRRARSPRPRAARGRAGRTRRRGAGRPRRRAAELAAALRRLPAHARARAVHRHRQSLGGVRAGARARARRDLGRRRPAARRAAQPRRARARCRAAAPGARRRRAACSPGTPAPPTSSASSRSGGCARLPAARRASPRVVLSATREGESRGARVPSAAFAAAREALADGPVLVQVARPGYAPVLVCAECRHPARCPHCGGPLHAARAGRGARVHAGAAAPRPAGRAPTARRPACAWRRRAASAPPTSSAARSPARGSSSPTARTRSPQVDARPALVVATRGAEPIAVGRLSRRDPARRRSDAARRRSADRRVVPALVVERRRPRGPGRAGAPRRRRGTRRARARDLDPARLRARRARRPRAAADAADRPRRGARGRPARRRRRARGAARRGARARRRRRARPASTATAPCARSCASTTRSARR